MAAFDVQADKIEITSIFNPINRYLADKATERLVKKLQVHDSRRGRTKQQYSLFSVSTVQ